MFLKRARSVIGLDIGTRAVKALELTWDGAPRITGFACAEVPSAEATSDTVARVLRDGAFRTRRVVTAVSGKSVIVRYLTMFKMGPEALKAAVRFEADKYVPFDVADVVMDSQPLSPEGQADLGPNEMRVLLVACKRSLVADQMRVLSAHGLQPQVVDVDAFALGNAFALARHPQGEAARKVAALVDVGASKTSVNVLAGATSLFTREIHAAGDAFTAAIASRLDLGQADAEALKRKPGQDEGRVRDAVSAAVADLSNEIRLSFDYFENQFDRGIDEVLLSGGGARLVGLVDDLGTTLGKPTATWDPTGDVAIAPSGVDAGRLREHMMEVAVAMGLASRGAQ